MHFRSRKPSQSATSSRPALASSVSDATRTSSVLLRLGGMFCLGKAAFELEMILLHIQDSGFTVQLQEATQSRID